MRITWKNKNIKLKNVFKLFTWCLLSVLLSSQGLHAEIFVTPKNLEDNVAFWKKIYTETSLQAGIIHDREYPLIIYKTITIGNRKGRSRRNYIRHHISQIKQQLQNLLHLPQTRWNSKEKEIYMLFLKYASASEIKNAEKRIRFQQGQRERFKEGLERSGAYMKHILAVFMKHNIPPRIAYLPHVESSFNPRAYSRVGAAGMWQFMRRTGRLYLSINYRVDERFDPFRATEAAAKLLKRNYEKLKSWPLAITAYNHGLASISRAVRVTKSRDLGIIIEKYKNRRFKFASKNFYGCFMAASEIAANPEKYFSNIDFHPQVQYNEITLRNYYRPQTITKYLGVSQQQLKALNPSLRSIVFRRQLSIPRGFKLRVPQTISIADAQQKLGMVPPKIQKVDKNGVRYYSVKRGDTLYRISRMFKIPTDELIIANEISREDRIYIGQVLRIPGKDKPVVATLKQTPPPDKPVDSGDTNLTATGSTTPATQTPVPPPSSKSSPSPAATQSTIDKKENGTSVEAVESQENKSSIFDATLYDLEVEVLPGGNQARIVATMGESMGHYAEWLNSTVGQLRRLNRGRRSIRVHQKIKIPVSSDTALEEFKRQRLEYHMAQEEDFYTNYKVIDTKERIVRYGDTLWSICQRDEEIPIWLLKKYNRQIDLEALKVKMKLVIPVVTPITE